MVLLRTRSNNSCVASSLSTHGFDVKIFPDYENLSTTNRMLKEFHKKSDAREHEEMIFRDGKYLRKLG